MIHRNRCRLAGFQLLPHFIEIALSQFIETALSHLRICVSEPSALEKADLVHLHALMRTVGVHELLQLGLLLDAAVHDPAGSGHAWSPSAVRAGLAPTPALRGARSVRSRKPRRGMRCTRTGGRRASGGVAGSGGQQFACARLPIPSSSGRCARDPCRRFALDGLGLRVAHLRKSRARAAHRL